MDLPFVAATRLWRPLRGDLTSAQGRTGVRVRHRRHLHSRSGSPFGRSDELRDRRLSAPHVVEGLLVAARVRSSCSGGGWDNLDPQSQGGPETAGGLLQPTGGSFEADFAVSFESGKKLTFDATQSRAPPPTTPRPGPVDLRTQSHNRPVTAKTIRTRHFEVQAGLARLRQRSPEPALPSLARTASRPTAHPPTPTTAAFSV